MNNKLFEGSGEESDTDLQLGTNTDYAKSYNNFRKKELLKKLKDRGVDVSESESSSDSDSTDDEVLDVQFDEEFLKTLASLKSKNPTIYDKNTKFFQNSTGADDSESNEDDGRIVKKETKAKPLTLKDYERNIILEKGGKYEDDSDAESENGNKRAASPTIAEEEHHLRAEFKNIMNNADSDEEDFGGIFKKREKSKEEKDREEADYLQWLAGKKEDVTPKVKAQLEPLKNYWNSGKLSQSEKFLRDYILNKGYANTNSGSIPTYDEIVGDDEEIVAKLSDDEKELEKQAEFEHKYNFRFEEPDSQFIQRFPRTIENSVRRTEDKRKQKREEIKERKQQEKEMKMKEIEIVKEMKRKEIEDKIEKLKMVTGNDELGFKDDELEEDFDPEAHDRRMRELFDDDYYKVDEAEKPECPSDMEELKVEDWDNYDPKHGVAYDDDIAPHCEDDDFNMDCDYDPAVAKEQFQKELIESTRTGRRNRKGRRNKFMEIIQKEKPAFNPEDEKTYAEYIDEYYQLDCEDIIGDVPCRFKYVETTPNDFGLTIEEILLAKNKELNQWASLKKAIQIRPEQVEKKDQRLYKLKAHNLDLKRKIFKSLYGEGSDDEEEVDEFNKDIGTEEQSQKGTESTSNQNEKKKRKKKKRKAASTTLEPMETNDDMTTSTETSVKKQKLENDSEEKTNTTENIEAKQTQNKKKRRKKNKNKEIVGMEGQAGGDKTQDRALPCSTDKEKNVTNNIKNPFNNQQKNQHKPAQKHKIQSNAKTTDNATNPFKSQQKNNIQPIKPYTTFNNESNTNATKSASNIKNPFTSQHKNNQKSVIANFKLNTKNGKGKFKRPEGKFKTTSAKDNSSSIADNRLKAYGISPRTFHKKQKYGVRKDINLTNDAN